MVGWAGPRACLYVLEKRKFSCPYLDSNAKRAQPVVEWLYRLEVLDSYATCLIRTSAIFQTHKIESKEGFRTVWSITFENTNFLFFFSSYVLKYNTRSFGGRLGPSSGLLLPNMSLHDDYTYCN
jgi:hypothetical protein